MSYYSHCQVCGRKVMSAYFCRKCEGAFCTLRCLEQHTQKHAAVATAAPDHAARLRRMSPQQTSATAG